jgi:hypothetical protein
MDFSGKQIGAPLPGVVVAHSAAQTQQYLGSPSLLDLGGERLMASHDEFGPGSTEHTCARTRLFFSADGGATWMPRAIIDGAFWSVLFSHRGAIYLLGTDRHHGNIVIRRSIDEGQTWTSPIDGRTGLLRSEGEYHCGPLPVVEHDGRLWRAFERRDPPEGWAPQYGAGVMSVPVDADLLAAENWVIAGFLPSDRGWHGGDMGGWLEGNIVVTPSGDLVNILRVDTKSPDEVVAVVEMTEGGTKLNFDPASGFWPFPGGAKLFALRFDPLSQRCWTIAGPVAAADRGPPPGWVRNNLVLQSSPDLKIWTENRVLLYHPDPEKHGFQYVSWTFAGDDIVFLCRTAFDDAEGGAHTKHDSNFISFHRIRNFRE